MKAKLVIWDLDDTLWRGTLAEGDVVELFEHRAATIKKLNERGVVSSICSKNNPEDAERQLRTLGIWEEFVFPTIAFLPKGEIVQSIIADMNLRAPDVVFIDDNEHNRREVEFLNEGIVTVDPVSNEADELLEKILQAFEGVKRNRIDEYRILEKKRNDASKAASNDDFLASCGIHICLVRRADNLRFAERIEELINRTNQLNFTKSRVQPGTMKEYLINPHNETWSVFVWDKYGFHGLVGFVAISYGKLEHFAFSCRIMNMKIENAVAKAAKYRLKIGDMPVKSVNYPWITWVDPNSDEFREKVTDGEGANTPVTVRIMANCQSGAIAHYLGQDGIDWDNAPRTFTLPKSLDPEYELGFLPFTIYGAFNDYSGRYWPDQTLPDVKTFQAAALALVERIPSNVKIFAILLPPEEDQTGPLEIFRRFNQIWREIAKQDERILIVNMADFCPAPQKDPRHYTADQLAQVANLLKPTRTRVEVELMAAV